MAVGYILLGIAGGVSAMLLALASGTNLESAIGFYPFGGTAGVIMTMAMTLIRQQDRPSLPDKDQAAG